MRILMATLALLVLPATLSGCLTDESAGGNNGGPNGNGAVLNPWPAIASAMAEVPCEAPVNSGQSPNLVQLANVSYDFEMTGIHGELDISGNLALHARYAQGGFELIDIADPLNPVHLGFYDYNDEDGGDGLDVKFSPDNATAIFGTSAGLRMVDIRNPSAPVAAGQWNFTDATIFTDPLPRVSENGHMLYTARIAEQDWVFLAPNSNTGAWILRMDGTPDARKLTYVTQTLPVEGGPLGPHDIFVQQDTQDGNWYLYSADGFHGWTVFNINDPTNPTVAGGFLNPLELAYTHSVQAEWVNGRRLVATIGEVGVNVFKIYDATNLAAPLLLTAYQASPGPGSTAPEHNFNMVGGKLYLSYYTLGMYIFDLTQLSGIPLVDSATFQPVAHWGQNPEQAPGPTDFSGIWDTVLKDGLIYLSDIEGGIHVVGYGCNGPYPNTALTSSG